MVGRVFRLVGRDARKSGIRESEPPSASGSEDVRRTGIEGVSGSSGSGDSTDRSRWRRGGARKPPCKICSNRLDKALFIDGSNEVRPTDPCKGTVGLTSFDPPYGYFEAGRRRCKKEERK